MLSSTTTARRPALVLALLVVLAALLGVPGSPATAGGSASVDPRIGASDCRLLGRAYVAGQGCSRTHCRPGAHLLTAGRGAEVCGLRGRGDHPFATDVAFDRCAALHRVWVAAVNWCASNPDRSVATIAHAPQCTGSRTTYVTHSEREGFYDECLSPAAVRRAARLARRDGTSVGRAALVTSPTLCGYRPGHVFAGGRCVAGHDPADAAGGVLLVGDSIAWRGTDELARILPGFTLDGIPSRTIGELGARLDRFRVDHGQPDGVVVELGTNASPGFTRTDLAAVLATLPARTVVMLVLPYRQNSHAPPAIQPSSTRYAHWMRDLAAVRPLTCTADWRAQVARRPSLLVDGVHPTHRSESYWARWTARAWRSCVAASVPVE